jgi:glycosyltransferase involved in cell wall biosynthesis
MNQIDLTHYFPFFSTLGGVESILRRHVLTDVDWGFRSNVIAFFEPASSKSGAMTGVGLTWRDCIASARRKFRNCVSPGQGSVAVYHNAWGVPFLADLDGAARRVSLIHTDSPGINQVFQSQAGSVDGIMCVNDQLAAQARRALPHFDPARITVLPYPISAPNQTIANQRALSGHPIVLGYVGRLIKEQKRVDRLPRLCQMLDQHKIGYRFEILGEGEARQWLEKHFRGNSKIVFHGRRGGDDYWQILAAWDAVVYVSDYEGLPISLLEALSLGVLPIYPRIKSGGDSYTERVRPDLLYPPEDFDYIANLLRALQQSPDAAIESLRNACRELAKPHLGDFYERNFSAFIRKIIEWPRISASSPPSRPLFLSDHIPFGALRRFYYRGFFKRNN